MKRFLISLSDINLLLFFSPKSLTTHIAHSYLRYIPGRFYKAIKLCHSKKKKYKFRAVKKPVLKSAVSIKF